MVVIHWKLSPAHSVQIDANPSDIDFTNIRTSMNERGTHLEHKWNRSSLFPLIKQVAGEWLSYSNVWNGMELKMNVERNRLSINKCNIFYTNRNMWELFQVHFSFYFRSSFILSDSNDASIAFKISLFYFQYRMHSESQKHNCFAHGHW